MTCNAVIATRTGLHLRCRLEDQHDGACVPQIPDCVPRPMPMVVEMHEATFLSHLLNLLQAAVPSPIGPLFPPGEAINLCRSLIWQRLGRGPF